MNLQRTRKRVVLFVLPPASAFYLGLRLFAQCRHVDVYVSRQAPMPAELAAGLHVEEHKIGRTVTIESPYESATDKIMSAAEISRLRSAMAWSKGMPVFIDSLRIQSPTCVLARRTTSRVMLEYQLAKHGDQWVIESATRSELGGGTAQKD